MVGKSQHDSSEILNFLRFCAFNSYKKNSYKQVSVHWFVATFLRNAHNPSSSNGKVTLS